MSWQLVVHGDADIRAEAARAMRAEFKRNQRVANVVEAPNIAGALEAIEEQGQAADGNGLDTCNMVIIGSTTPADANASAAQTGRDPTRQLIRHLKAQSPRLVLIVLTKDPDDRLADFLDAFQFTSLVPIDANFSTLLGTVLAKSFEGGEPMRGCIQLNIHLVSKAQGSNWLLNRNGAWLGDGPLEIDSDKLQDLLDDSERLSEDVYRKSKAWRKDMEKLAADLHELLFQSGSSNVGCLTTFIKYRERAGGIRNARVRITVDNKTHPMLLEVLRDNGKVQADARPEPGDQFWMLDAPVYRRYGERSAARPPLFKDAASRVADINALIIEADGAAGNIPIPSSMDALTVTALPSVREEADEVRRILEESHVNVWTLRVSEETGDVGKQVLDALQRKKKWTGHSQEQGPSQWHLVHFCGHLGSMGSEAGLILRGERDGFLSVKRLAVALDRVQLLFLSSCQSASAPEVMQAVEQHVPAVIGFQWVIDDLHAKTFAAAFYHWLFERNPNTYRYLEYAFTKARSEVHDQAPEMPSWVAPVLVMQTA